MEGISPFSVEFCSNLFNGVTVLPIYNKLVRDRIPEIIESHGKTAEVRILADEEFEIELRKKLQEELDEYLSAETTQDALEELADIVELILTLAYQHGAAQNQIEQIRKKKQQERGGFDKRLFLIEVHDNHETLG
jgi:predicted house-cleaning noncanonical NTP pyrophosphatase (MazG superfamily)